MAARIPESHKDLLAGPVNVVLTTVFPDGQPQTTPIWCNLDGDDVLINTMKEFRKQKNMRLNPKVTLLAYHLKQPLRNIEVRGRVVEMTEEGALEHLNELNALYDGAGRNSLAIQWMRNYGTNLPRSRFGSGRSQCAWRVDYDGLDS